MGVGSAPNQAAGPSLAHPVRRPLNPIGGPVPQCRITEHFPALWPPACFPPLLVPSLDSSLPRTAPLGPSPCASHRSSVASLGMASAEAFSGPAAEARASASEGPGMPARGLDCSGPAGRHAGRQAGWQAGRLGGRQAQGRVNQYTANRRRHSCCCPTKCAAGVGEWQPVGLLLTLRPPRPAQQRAVRAAARLGAAGA